jgi:diketogulonate reductase-like aldo/keto reductase
MAKLDINSKLRMSSGFEIPILGYGVSIITFNNNFIFRMLIQLLSGISDVRMTRWFLSTSRILTTSRPAAECEAVTLHAFKTGYRHVGPSLHKFHIMLCSVSHIESLDTISYIISRFLPCNQSHLLSIYRQLTIHLKVDSAAAYRNEAPCARAMKASGIPRSELFFTSKIPPRGLSYEKTVSQIHTTLKETGLDYIDLMLIHAPYGGSANRKGTWKALVEAQEAGKIRSLGISNYGVQHLDELEQHIKELEAERGGAGRGGVISVGQWELHPWLARPDIVKWCHAKNVVLEAYSPLVRAKRNDEPILQPMMKKYGKTATQILLRWSLQMGFVPLPKSVTLSRIEENADVYDFELTKEEMKSLDTGKYEPCAWDPTVAKLEE